MIEHPAAISPPPRGQVVRPHTLAPTMNHPTRAHLAASAIALAALAAAATGADNFNCTITPAQSTAAYTVTASAPFTGNMIGDTAATPATRTKTGSFSIFPPFVSCGSFGAAQNDPLTISGSKIGRAHV